MSAPVPLHSAAERLGAVRERIALACARAGRDPAEVTLVAVGKTHTAASIAELGAEGQRDFGENYLQEAEPKINALADHGLCWHFIGHIQSNKCTDIARYFDWVHSVDRVKIARRLSDAARQLERTLNIMIQVNVQDEAGKSGVSVARLPALLDEVAVLEGVRLRGLMAIPEPADDFDAQRRPCAALYRLLVEARDAGIPIDCLSMGMSADLEAAITEGSTHVRVGTALFGPRDYSPKA